jgi:hypothetical protein
MRVTPMRFAAYRLAPAAYRTPNLLIPYGEVTNTPARSDHYTRLPAS